MFLLQNDRSTAIYSVKCCWVGELMNSIVWIWNMRDLWGALRGSLKEKSHSIASLLRIFLFISSHLPQAKQKHQEQNLQAVCKRQMPSGFFFFNQIGKEGCGASCILLHLFYHVLELWDRLPLRLTRTITHSQHTQECLLIWCFWLFLLLFF